MNTLKVNRKHFVIGLALLCLTMPAFSLSCTAASTAAPESKAPASTTAPATNAPATTTAPASNVPVSTTASETNAPQNKTLDFDLVNQTGYSIKLLYIGPSNNPEWTADMEILKGRTFRTDTEMEVSFSPRTQARKWDIMVEWTDGSKSAQWLGLDLSTIEKLTILYNAETDKTSFRIN